MGRNHVGTSRDRLPIRRNRNRAGVPRTRVPHLVSGTSTHYESDTVTGLMEQLIKSRVRTQERYQSPCYNLGFLCLHSFCLGDRTHMLDLPLYSYLSLYLVTLIGPSCLLQNLYLFTKKTLTDYLRKSRLFSHSYSLPSSSYLLRTVTFVYDI